MIIPCIIVDYVTCKKWYLATAHVYLPGQVLTSQRKSLSTTHTGVGKGCWCPTPMLSIFPSQSFMYFSVKVPISKLCLRYIRKLLAFCQHYLVCRVNDRYMAQWCTQSEYLALRWKCLQISRCTRQLEQTRTSVKSTSIPAPNKLSFFPVFKHSSYK